MVTSNDSMSLASRCDANSDCMLVTATHVMSWLSLSIDKVTGTNVYTGLLEQGFTSRGSMYLAIRCNSNRYCMLVIATHVMS